ncbi:exodeoxyribonuclease III [Lactobacillus iners]|mgnify:FL=1|jgi:exodeoxyribonuclease III|uniref:Exodeoxyribonuclease n=1 Tax=Lactobacillus iners TaxID=147802 RepID=A0A6G7BB87_9LACO|nr:exodeoxyribonuclease III [Lactobacillus iners]EGY59168.1 exodeoxyribonuclease [Lactobacillus iners]MCT7670402.1 exodeoxyribonuclease III [Lactobacillus iners]MCT7671342.1 exodeoxyribonuclease III [Lactobacillus iners]MCT7682533.1 exodeoxyribonuclease III [Lactobacillus iners]MCT7684357.1 exodeoxyribonuclease III [Lactobacillus iners]
MLFISWNIDSLNAALTGDSDRANETRSVLNKIKKANPDVVAIQETKLRANGPTKKHCDILADIFEDYQYVWRSSQEPARKSYAGTMFLYKKNYHPQVTYPLIGAPDTMDQEGRIITLEFDTFYLTQVYTPNSGNELKRLADREIWDTKYQEYLAKLDQNKPVIASGDYNVAHQEIDLKHPETNHHNAGFTDEERKGFSKLLSLGFIDTFRYINGDITDVYSWWSQRIRTSKTNNAGWRIDYYLVSQRLADKIEQSKMIDTGDRKDHCPILLKIDL